MKKVKGMLAMAAAMALCVPALAQDTPQNTNTTDPAMTTPATTTTTTMTTTDRPVWDQAAMKEGKVWLTQGTETMVMEKATKVGPAVVFPDGSIRTRDGGKATLEEGDMLMADGGIVRSPKPANEDEEGATMEEKATSESMK